MALVTLSASYGAGGSRIGPLLSERLGVPFVDRAIPVEVAERLAVPVEQALGHDQAVEGLLERMVRYLAPAPEMYGAPPVLGPNEHVYRVATEQVIRERAAGGSAVILGRAAAVVLADDERALRVRLDGPRERRIAQATRLEGIDQATAERRLDETDGARDAYVSHFYGADAHDQSLYHLVIDSTTIALDACVEMIELALRSR